MVFRDYSVAKLEERSNIYYVVWDLEFNSLAINKIYPNKGHAKNAINNFYEADKHKHRNKDRRVVVAEVKLEASGKKWFKDGDEWKELEGMNKFLYG